MYAALKLSNFSNKLHFTLVLFYRFEENVPFQTILTKESLVHWFHLWHILVTNLSNHLFCGTNLTRLHSEEQRDWFSRCMLRRGKKNKLMLFWVCVVLKLFLPLHQTCTWQLNICHPPNHAKSTFCTKNSPCFNWCTFPITCLQCSIYMQLSAQQLCWLTWQITCSQSHLSSSHHPSGILVRF